MRTAPMLATASILILGATSVAIGAEMGRGASGETPGHEMQEHGSVPGHPGASGYAPGHNKDADDVRGKRHETTGAGRRDRDDVKIKGDRDRDDMKFKGDHDRDDHKVKRDRD
jgi:hypothetical protein